MNRKAVAAREPVSVGLLVDLEARISPPLSDSSVFFHACMYASAAANGVRAARTRELAERDGSAAPTAAQLAVDRSLPLTASVQNSNHPRAATWLLD